MFKEPSNHASLRFHSLLNIFSFFNLYIPSLHYEPSHHIVWNLISLTTYLCLPLLSAQDFKNCREGRGGGFYEMQSLLWYFNIFTYTLLAIRQIYTCGHTYTIRGGITKESLSQSHKKFNNIWNGHYKLVQWTQLLRTNIQSTMSLK